jgi:hypothetical protein
MVRFMMLKLFVLIFCSLFAETLFAKPKDDKASTARTYFAKGEELFEKGEYLEAATAFQQAYALSPHPSALSNIGYCYEYAKSYVKAVTTYREFLAADLEKDPTTVEDIRNRLARLQRLVGELHIQCRPGECTAEIDGVLKGDTSDGTLVLLMEPGKYSILVRQADEQSRSGIYRVEAGEKTFARFSFENELTAQGKGESVGSSPMPSQTRSKEELAYKLKIMKVAFYSLTGGALVSGTLIVVFGALTLKFKSDYTDSGYRDPEAQSRTHTFKSATNISVGIASVLAAGALTVKIFEIGLGKREANIKISLAVDGNNIFGIKGSFK